MDHDLHRTRRMALDQKELLTGEACGNRAPGVTRTVTAGGPRSAPPGYDARSIRIATSHVQPVVSVVK